MCTGIALRALEASGVNVTLSVCGALVRSLVASPVACNGPRRMLHVARRLLQVMSCTLYVARHMLSHVATSLVAGLSCTLYVAR